MYVQLWYLLYISLVRRGTLRGNKDSGPLMRTSFIVQKVPILQNLYQIVRTTIVRTDKIIAQWTPSFQSGKIYIFNSWLCHQI